MKYRLSLPLTLLFAGAFFLAACNAEPEQPETMEDAVEDTEGPIEEEMQQELGLYDTFDADSDTYLTEDEFVTGYSTTGLYDTYDADGDTYLTEEEYGTYADAGFDSVDNYGTYDTDGDARLSMDEFHTGLFSRMDDDGDGQISRAEFETYEPMMSMDDDMM